MKRYIIFIVFLTLFLTLSLAACAENNKAQQPVTEESAFIAEELADAPVEDEDNYQIVIYTADDMYDEYYFNTKAALKKCSTNALHETILTKDNNEQYTELLAENRELLKNFKIKAIIIENLAPGLRNLFAQIRELRPDVSLIVLDSSDRDIIDIFDTVDIFLCMDILSIGKKMLEQAHSMGSDTFVYYTVTNRPEWLIPFAEPEQYKELCKQTCSSLKMKYIEEEVDGMSPMLMFDADVLEKITKYGDRTSFFVDSCLYQGSLIRSVFLNKGGLYVQPCHPSLYHRFIEIPGFYYAENMLELATAPEQFDYARLVEFDNAIKHIETTLTEQGFIGSFATWKVPFALIAITAAMEYAKGYCEGEISGTNNLQAMRQCFQKGLEIYNSADTGFEITQHPEYPNCFLFMEDYIVLQGNRE